MKTFDHPDRDSDERRSELTKIWAEEQRKEDARMLLRWSARLNEKILTYEQFLREVDRGRCRND